MYSQFLIIVPTAGRTTHLARTLQSLSQCDLPARFGGVLVVENGSPKGAKAIAHDADARLKTRYVHCEIANKSLALNYTMAPLLDDCLVYLTDDDVRFSRGTLTQFEKATSKRTSGVVLGGPLDIDSDKEPPDWILPYLPPSMKGWLPEPKDIDAERVIFLGANWALFVGDAKKVGGFDERFGPGSQLNATGQEWNMQKRLRAAGCRFAFVPDALVWHHVNMDRLTPEFVISRTYRMGVESGISAAIRPWKSMREIAIVFYMFFRALCRFFQSSAFIFWHKRSEEERSRQAFQHAQATGFLYGFIRSFGRKI